MSRARINLFTFLAIFVAGVVSCPSYSVACTGMKVVAKDGSVIWARSMEFGSYIGSSLMVSPHGIKWVSPAPQGKKGLHWTAKYGFVGPDGFNLSVPLEGMNEKGLYIGGFWMKEGETTFPDVQPAEYPRTCLLYTSPSPRDLSTSRMPSSA
eukprot:TRINITY_DN10614_c0_g1_i2.p6 TRINITY_DN10614_c0_g1~~TRINITY_DN10614_c0_g1_i2.p6  ORF type:complete len:152 (-),score=18.13 TRINITY_DN10614_c0_g1_i2:123-578(-)